MADLLIPEEMGRQMTTQLQQILSAVSMTAIGVRKFTPRAGYVTGPSSITIPSGTKSFNIINLGLDGENQVFEPIEVDGIAGITEIHPAIRVFGYTIENDQDLLDGVITVMPATDHLLLIQYLK